jgi:hypothetical protein
MYYLSATNASVAGALTSTNLTVPGTITGGTFSGTLSQTAMNTITNLTNLNAITVTGNITTANLSVTSGADLNNLTLTGSASMYYLSATNTDISGSLTVTGTITAQTLTAVDVYANTVHDFQTVSHSDIRLKTNITTLSPALSKILALRPVTYNWKNPSLGAGRQTGFIAQELRKQFPEFVVADKSGMLSVNYAAMVSPIVKSIQEQQQEIDTLKKQNQELLQRLQQLEDLIKKSTQKKK